AGTNFTGATGVSFGGVAATTFTVNSATQITATVPTGAVTGKIRVTTPAGFGESAANFTVVPAPQFNALNPFTPRSGFVGTAVSINGTNFNVDSPTPPQVFFGTFAAVVTTFTATSIQVTVPAGGPGTVSLRVRTSGGEISSADLVPAVSFNML
ncbi:MAG TPA: IPT/TIG domain-containing protein, partial [Syntrophobacteria bacterium]|nr:IPT/TIG domain-containing protein [Syntrophobacteria bacterium]